MKKITGLLCLCCIVVIVGVLLFQTSSQNSSSDISIFDLMKETAKSFDDLRIENNDQKKEESTQKKTAPVSKEDSVISQDVIPYHKELKVPQSVQETSYYCGCAALQMVLRYHGIEKSQTELAKEMHTDPVTGTEYDDLARVANKYLFDTESASPQGSGYRVQRIAINDRNPLIEEVFEERVKQDIASQDPIFVAVDVKALYPQLHHGNHLIVIYGYECYDNREEIAWYKIIDPSYVIQDEVYGGRKRVSAKELINAIVTDEEPAYIW